jgi:hypothetical protein
MAANVKHVPDAVRRASVAPPIRDRHKLRAGNDPGSAAHRDALRPGNASMSDETRPARRLF